MFYIRTQRLGTFVGPGDGVPELFATRRDARQRADELRDATPSKYGRLIVSEYVAPAGAVNVRPMDDTTAMDAIHALLDGREWSADTIAEVAQLVSATGREIGAPR